MLTAAALVFLINVGTAVFNWLFQRVGRFGTQVFIFALALIAALYWQYGTQFPSLQGYVQAAIVLFSLAVAFYEVLLRYFPAFSGPQEPVLSSDLG